jgi:hypothetical protein
MFADLAALLLPAHAARWSITDREFLAISAVIPRGAGAAIVAPAKIGTSERRSDEH